jgi:hypothetical protein
MTALAETIAKFHKSPRDRTRHVRVDLSEYEGHKLVSVRVWETGSDGIDRPTKQGVALAIRRLPELTNALLKAEDRARALGLLDDNGANQGEGRFSDVTTQQGEGAP